MKALTKTSIFTTLQKRRLAVRSCRECGKRLPFLYKGDFCKGKCYKAWRKKQKLQSKIEAKDTIDRVY